MADGGLKFHWNKIWLQPNTWKWNDFNLERFRYCPDTTILAVQMAKAYFSWAPLPQPSP